MLALVDSSRLTMIVKKGQRDNNIERVHLDKTVSFYQGSETTGGTFISGDSRYYFVNIQHPDSSNPAPFDKSCTIVIDLGK